MDSSMRSRLSNVAAAEMMHMRQASDPAVHDEVVRRHKQAQQTSAPPSVDRAYLERQWVDQWVPMHTDDGQVYYYHERLGLTEWEIPPYEHNEEEDNERSRQPTAYSKLRKTVSGKAAPFAGSAHYQLARQFYAKDSNRFVTFFHSVLEYRLYQGHWSVRESLQMLAFAAANFIVVYLINTTRWPLEKRFGFLAAGNAFIVVVPALRNSLLTLIFGVPFDRLIVFHRFMGRFLLVIVTIHMALYINTWQNQGLDANDQLFNTTAGKYGFASWMFLLSVNFTSLEYFRRHHYNLFYYSHFAFVPFYAFAYLHCFTPSDIEPFFYAAAALYAGDRMLRSMWSAHITRCLSLTVKPGNIVMIRFKKHPIAQWLGLYKVGQYVFLNFPGVSLHSLMEWHPFTLSSGPDEAVAEVHIRALGDYTTQFIDYCKTLTDDKAKQLLVRAEGPYGKLRVPYWRYPGVCLMAAGVGITPVVAILKDIYQYGSINESSRRLPAKNVIQSVIVTWTIPSLELFSWFAKELSELYSLSESELHLPALSIWIYISRQKAEEIQIDGRPFDGAVVSSSPSSVPAELRGALPEENFKYGKPRFEEILQVSLEFNQQLSHLVVVCGSSSFVGDVQDAAYHQRRKGHRFDLHEETFDW